MTAQEVLQEFEKGYDCGQVIFHHFAGRFGMDEELAYKVSTGFGAGMMQGETCGSVIAAYMVLGLIYGFSEEGETGAEKKVRSIIRNEEFRQAFLKKYPSTMCRDLLEADFSTYEGKKKIEEKKLMVTFCPQLAADIINILDEMLKEEGSTYAG